MFAYVYKEEHGTGQGFVSHPALPESFPTLERPWSLHYVPHTCIMYIMWHGRPGPMLDRSCPFQNVPDICIYFPYWFPGDYIHVSGWGVQAKQKERILSLVEEERYPDYFLVWMTVVQRIMHLHSRLFKRGVWWGHVDRCHSMEAPIKKSPMSETYEAFSIIVCISAYYGAC